MKRLCVIVTIFAVSWLEAQQRVPGKVRFELWEGYTVAMDVSERGWQVSGEATITDQDQAQHSQSLYLAADGTAVLPLRTNTHSLLFVDGAYRPGVSDQALLDFAGAQVGFVDAGEGAGVIAVNAGAGWQETACRIPLQTQGFSKIWLRLTLRLDLTRGSWDLYGNKRLLAADLPLLHTGATLTELAFAGPACVDNLYLATKNPLFADEDLDGMHDAYESAKQQQPGLADRDGDADQDGTSNIEEYLADVAGSNDTARGTITRQVWTGIWGAELDRLVAHPAFPDHPTITDALTQFETPTNWAWGYGTRIRGYLHPPLDGDYTFWISGDDHCALYLSSSTDPDLAEPIAHVSGWTEPRNWSKYPEQQSQTITLRAGEVYYIEALHKEAGGGDHLSVAWELPGAFDRQVITGVHLAPFEPAPLLIPRVELAVGAGADIIGYFPRQTYELKAGFFKRRWDATVEATWRQVAGPAEATLLHPHGLRTRVHLPVVGTYTFEIALVDGFNLAVDTVDVTLHESLIDGATGVTREMWLGLDGGWVHDLRDEPAYQHKPMIKDVLPSFETPEGIADNYGQRLTALLVPPTTGTYRFYIVSDDHSELFLSPDESVAGLNRIAYLDTWSRYRTWGYHASQVSAEVELEAGQSYLIQVLHKEGGGNDYVSVAWEGPEIPLQAIDSVFLMPAEIAPRATPLPTVVAYTGDDRRLYQPDHSAILQGTLYTLNVDQEQDVVSGQWTQIDGPALATFADAQSATTQADFPVKGVYTICYEAMLNGRVVHKDDIRVDVREPLAENTGTILREVWTAISYSDIAYLLAHEDYPHNPYVRDLLPSLHTPANWHDTYGQRLRGYLHIPETGTYRFHISGDDQGQLLIGPDGTPASAELAASLPSWTYQRNWDRYPEQASTALALEAGDILYIEVLHKEGWGGDHLDVGWETPFTNGISVIPGGVLSPFSDQDLAPFDPSVKVHAHAGPDRQVYFPRQTVALEGSIRVRTGQDGEDAAVQWSKISGPAGAGFLDASIPETTFTLQAAGEYVLELAVECDGTTHRDTVTITVLPPLNDRVGSVLREVWLEMSGGNFMDLANDERYPDAPTFQDELSTFEGPSHWGYYYGTRVRGYVHPPATGSYTFMVSGDSAALYLSPTEQAEDAEQVAYTDEWNSPRQIRTAAQTADPVTLEAGKRYYIELLHKETTGSDHFAVQWEGPGIYGREVVAGAFLSPFAAAADTHPELLVLAGENQQAFWPYNQFDLLGTVYDMDHGPESLAYEWRLVEGPGVAVFSDPVYPATQVTFSEPGEYVMGLSASDGLHAAEDTLVIHLDAPLAEGTGGLLREVWLDAPGSQLHDFSNAEGYPRAPAFADLAVRFEGPTDQAEQTATRYRGYLHIPADGQYQFFIASDDHSELLLGLDGTPDSAQQVASVQGWVSRNNWRQRESQISPIQSLSAGQTVYIEARHKQGWGREHLAVAWERQGVDEQPVIIDGAFLSPFSPAPARETELLVVTGQPIDTHMPENVHELKGWVLDLYPGPLALAIRWETVSGPADAEFSDPTAAQTAVRFPEPGQYRLRLSADDGENTLSAELSVHIGAALADSTGAILREVWEGVGHYRLYSLLGDSSYPDTPSYRDLLTELATPNRVGDQYGQRMRGYLHVPVDGSYRFRIAGDDDCSFTLNASGTSEDFWQPMDGDGTAYNVVTAHVSGATGQGEWDTYSSQVSASVELETGQSYYIEILHKEGWGDDHVEVQWLRPDRLDFARITGAYLSPYELDAGMPARPAVEFIPGTVTNSPFVSVPPAADDATFPEPDLPAYTPSDSIGQAEAARFLNQATFGATPDLIASVQAQGFAQWINDQMALPATLHLPVLDKTRELTDTGFTGVDNARERGFTWWTVAIESEDQLRQRVAFALSQIVVISDSSPALQRRTRGVTNYYDILVRNAFGNYRQILEEVTLNPMMGIYLSMLRNMKHNPETGSFPDENYARELMQLFSIGLHEMNPDGTLKQDQSGNPINTYGQTDILNFAKVLTGWTFGGSSGFHWKAYDPRQDISPLMAFEEYHDQTEKILLRGQVVPAGGTAYQDLTAVLDCVFQHPNTGPFIARRLIQRLVSSNPSPGYIYRVAQAFADNGNGIRGDLAAVVRAILLDPEARSLERINRDTTGKMREPIVRLTQLVRAFPAVPTWSPPTYGRYTFDTSFARVTGQAPLYASSVFNFFEPDFMPTGEAQDARVFAPEFQISNELAVIDTANYFHRGIHDGLSTHWMHPSVVLDFGALEARAADPAAIVDHLAVVLMDGDMSPAMRQLLLDTMASVSQQPWNQAVAALQLIYSSPEFVIQE